MVTGVTVFSNSDRPFYSPHDGDAQSNAGCRVQSETARATIAPRVNSPNIDSRVDINKLYFSFRQGHKEPLLRTTKHRGVTSTGKLRERKGCSIAMRSRRPIAKTIKRRADKSGGRVVLDIGGAKGVRSMGARNTLF